MNDFADHPESVRAATRLVASGRPDPRPGGGVNPPVDLTSTFHADGAVSYARMGNPTWSAFERALGALEGGRALAFASGMAAVSAALGLVQHGAVVVGPTHAYGGTWTLLRELDRTGALDVRWVDPSETEALVSAIDGADLVWVETPSNPLLEVADLATACVAGRDAGALVVVDNTFATPLRQQPLASGADVVVHSVTKYLSGHSDVVLGAAVTADTAEGHRLHDRLHDHRTIHGAVPGPFETWLALRGMRTLHLRLERAEENAAELVRRLSSHRAVSRVRYPGFGAIVSIEVVGDAPDAAEDVASATRVWTHSTSLGGVESQIERRRRHPTEPDAVPEALLRLSVGVEDVEDLWEDLDRALRASAHSPEGSQT